MKNLAVWKFGCDTKWFDLLSVLISFISLCFLTFSRVFSKMALFINLKEYFSKWFFAFFLGSVFISLYGFSYTLWLNWITSWTFFKTNPWFNACFKFLTWKTYSVFLCKLGTSFLNFSIFILWSKNGKSLWRSCNFSKYWTSTSRKYPSSLSSA